MTPAGFEPAAPQNHRPQTYAYGCIVDRTDTREKINICLGINLQTCVATFNPTSLSRLLATEGLLSVSLLIVGDANVT
jgi:hypothetical protein